MKRFIIGLFAASFIVSGCLKEIKENYDSSASPNGNGLVIIASNNTPLTKTDIDRGKSTWESGDEIAVIYDGKRYVYKTAQSGNQVPFTCVNGIENYDVSKGIVAYYPAISLDGVVSIPASQTISFNGEEQINSAKAPLVGVAENAESSGNVLQMSFRNICSILEFRIDPGEISDKVKYMKIEPSSEEGFEGYLSFSGTVNSKTLAVTPKTSGKTITLNLPENAVLNSTMTLKVPVGRFKSPSGLKLTAGLSNGTELSRIVYASGIETFSEANGVFSVNHFIKPMYHFAVTPEAVDLGLSVKWASFNVGASSPEGYGDYYAWGETEPKSDDYSWSNYKWCKGSQNTLTKYCPSGYSHYWAGSGRPDNKRVLDSEDDVACVKLGGKWRMPTDEEWGELINKCTWTWKSNYNGTGVNGWLVTGPNGNSIFLPAAAYRYGTDTDDFVVGFYGGYWSSSLNTDYPDNAWGVNFNSVNVIGSYSSRCGGRSVRPVFGDWHVSPVTLNESSLSLEIGQSYNLIASVSPDYASDRSLTWRSSDESIATVDQNGNVTAVSKGTATIKATLKDGSGNFAECSVSVYNNYAGAVDLGLPSGLKWAASNLSETGLCSNPWDYGDYYAWGETEPYYSSQSPLVWKSGKTAGYNWSSYKWGNKATVYKEWKVTKYCLSGDSDRWAGSGSPDNKRVLDSEDDVACVKLGGKWRMPTDEEWGELIDKCTWKWVGDYNVTGVNGRLVTGPNGNSIFLPAARYWGTNLYNVGSGGFYWSSSLITDNSDLAWSVYFDSDDVSGGSDSYRFDGLSVRPVSD